MEENKDIFDNSMFNADNGDIDDGLGDIFGDVPLGEDNKEPEKEPEKESIQEAKAEEIEQTIIDEPAIENIEPEKTPEVTETVDETSKEVVEETIEPEEVIEEVVESANETFDNSNEEQIVENIEEVSEEQDSYIQTVDEFEQVNSAFSSDESLITVRPVKFQEFDNIKSKLSIKKNLDIMQDVTMHISVELGRTKSTVRDIINMEIGSVVELEKIAGEQVEIFVNDKLVATGEVIVIEDKFGVRVVSTSIPKQTV